MGIVCWMLGLTPRQIGLLLSEPDLASDLTQVVQLMPREESVLADQHIPGMKDYIARHRERKKRITVLMPIENALCLENSWHILMYTIHRTTGSDQKSIPRFFSGDPLWSDLEYSPPILQRPEITRKLSEATSLFDLDQVKKQASYRKMVDDNVYGIPIGSPSDEDGESEVRRVIDVFFPKFKEYLRETALKQNGLLIWLR